MTTGFFGSQGCARWLAAGLLGVLLMGASTGMRAAETNVTLAWDPSPDTTVIGYNIYYGPGSRSYDHKVTVGNVTSAVISNLTAGATYYFAATAYNDEMLESEFSNEAVFAPTVPQLNNAPTLSPILDVSFREDVAGHTVALKGITSGDVDAQQVTVTAVSSNPDVVPNPDVTSSGPAGPWTLVFPPARRGASIITVTVNDGQTVNSTVSGSFTVNVTSAVNMAPTIDPIADVTIMENSGDKSVLVTGIGPGPGETQTVEVHAVSYNLALLTIPTVTYTGGNTALINFRPLPYARGSVMLTVSVYDGQARDNTTRRSFYVNVAAVNQPPTLDPLGNVVISADAKETAIALSGITSGQASENQALTFSAVSSNPQAVPAPRVAYAQGETQGMLLFGPLTNAPASALITVTVDDGAFTNSAVSRAFNVSVQSGNRPPTIDPVSDIALAEEAGTVARTVRLTGIGPGAASEDQMVTITVKSSDTELFDDPVVSYSSPNNTAWLTFTPKAYSSGSGTIEVRVSDGQLANSTTLRQIRVTVQPVNQPPSLGALENVYLAENAAAQVVALTGINSGAPNEIQTLRVTATSANPELLPNPQVFYTSPASAGTLALQPVTGAFGSTIVSVNVMDDGTSNNVVTRAFAVTIGAANRPPTMDLSADATIQENAGAQTVRLTGISAGAAHETNQTVMLTAESSNPALIPAPTISYRSPSSEAALSFMPANNTFGSAIITVRVTDGQPANNTLVRSFKLTVTPVNRAPTLDVIADVTVNENTGIQVVQMTGIGSGAGYEQQALAMTATSSDTGLINNPVINYASPNTAGWLSFSPKPFAFGTCTLTVTLDDGQPTNSDVRRTFRVTVNPVNQPPTLAQIPDAFLSEGAPEQTIPFTGVSSGASNETQVLTVTAVSSNPALILNPRVIYASPAATGTLLVQPVAGAFGNASITVAVSDGGAADSTVTRVFTISVGATNRPPTLDFVQDVILMENSPAATINLSGIGSGAAHESQVLTVSAKSGNPAVLPDPVVAYTSPAATGKLILTPAKDQSGSSYVTVTVYDGAATANTLTRTFKVTVQAINRAPTLAAIADVEIDENAAEQVITLSGISAGAVSETQPLVVTVSASDPSLIQNARVEYASPSTTGLLRLKPAAYAFGSCSISVSVNDGEAVNNLCIRVFNVRVRPVNQAPTLGSISDMHLAENAPLQRVSLSAIGTGAANETQTLAVSAVSSNPDLIPSPRVEYASPGSSGALLLQPSAGKSGTAFITVTVTDGAEQNSSVSRSFTVQIDAANRPPVLDAIADVTIPENSDVNFITLTGIHSGGDAEAQPITITASSSNAKLIPNPVVSYEGTDSEGALSFTPLKGVFGSATITVTVSDGQALNGACTRAFTVAVEPLNRPPTLAPIGPVVMNENAGELLVPLAGISAGADFERQVVTVTAASSNDALIPAPKVSYSSPNASGTLSIAPRPFAYGTCRITVTVSDGQSVSNAVSQAFDVTVQPVNQPPTLDHITDISMEENAAARVITITGITSGMSNEVQTLTVSAVSSNPDLLPNPRVSYVTPAPTGTLTVQPSPGAFGSATVTVTVQDGGPTDSRLVRAFTVTVGAVNRRPTFDPIASITIQENGSAAVQLTGVSPGASFEKQTVTLSASSSNPELLASPVVTYLPGASTGEVLLAPTAGKFGTATITITANDGEAVSGTLARTFEVNVIPMNRAPTLDAIANTFVVEDSGPATIVLRGISPGASHEVQPLTIRAVSANPSLIPNPSVIHNTGEARASLVFTPSANMSGAAQISVSVDDGQTNGATTRAFTVTVQPKNDAPTLDPVASHVMPESSTPRTVVLTGISAGPRETQELRMTAISSNPTLLPNPVISYQQSASTAVLTLAPLADGSGKATVRVSVDDGGAESNATTQSFEVEITPINRPPTLNAIPDVQIAENTAQVPVALNGITSGRATEAQALAVTAVSSNPSLVPAPEVAYVSPASQAALMLRPMANASGSAMITVSVNDGASSQNTVSRSFTVTIKAQNHPPTLEALNNITIQANSGARIIPLRGISAGPANENQTVRVYARSSNPLVIAHPAVAYSNGAEGSLTLELVNGASGSSVISVTVDDGQEVANILTRTFVATVSTVNATPTLDPLVEITLPENGITNILLSGITSGSSTEQQTLSVTAVSSDPKLLVPVLNYTSPDNEGTLTIVPTPFACGTATVTVVVSDGQAASGTLTRSFVVTIMDVNQPPTLDPLESRTIEENSGPQFIALSGISSGAPNENQRLTVTAHSSNTALIANPSVLYTNGSPSGLLSLNSVPNTSGEAVITVQVNDGNATNNVVSRKFRVVVMAVNQKPTLNPLANLTLNENAGPQTITVGGISSGAPDEAQKVTLTAFSTRPDIIPHPVLNYTSPNTFATLSFTPVPYAYGSATIIITADDGQFEDGVTTRSFTITVNQVNQAPTLDSISPLITAQNSGSHTVSLTGVTSGAPNESQTLSIVASSSNTKLVPAPVVTYTSPQSIGSIRLSVAPNMTGTATISVTVRDGSAQNGATTKTFIVAVGVGTVSGSGNTSNVPPTIDSIAAMSLRENAGTQVVRLIGITAGANERQALTVTATSSNPSVIPAPTVTYVSPESIALLSFCPATNAYGNCTITVTVDDGQSGNNITRKSFAVSIAPVNNPPHLSPLTNVTMALGAPSLTVPVTGIAAGPVNELQVVSLSATSSDPAVVDASLSYRSGNTAASLVLTPTGNSGRAIITITANDGQLENAVFERTFVVSVGVERPQPSLRPGISPQGTRVLTIFGQPGATYSLQTTCNPSTDAVWTPLDTRVTLTEDSAQVALPESSSPMMFYRLVEE